MSWQAMGTLAPYSEDETTTFLVWNGKQVGEARRHSTYDWDEETDDCLEVVKWAWTHHSTCGCCHGYMDPQPLAWQPMPEPPK